MIALAELAREMAPYIPPAGGAGGMIALVVYLLKRGERKDESATQKLLDLIEELKAQIVYWRDRAESEERARRRLERHLERARMRGHPVPALPDLMGEDD